MGVTRDEDIKLGYLFDPIFQAQNTAGKPLTDGWIEIYYHGTRTKYFAFSDFNRTLHPFRIPLDSLGSNIILADVAFSYDVYIYNKFGSLVMSRYDVKPHGTGSSESASGFDDLPEYWLGQYGATIRVEGNQAGVTLPIPSVPDYHGSFVEKITDTWGNHPAYMYLKPGIYFVKCVIRFTQDPDDIRNEYGEVLLYTGNGNANECRAWRRDVSGPDCPAIDGEYDQIRSASFEVSFIRRVLGDGETSHVDTSNILYFAPSTTVNWREAFIQNLQIVKLNSGGGSSKKYAEGDYISIIGDVISATGLQPAGDYVTPESMAEYVEESTSGFITSGEVEESYVDKTTFENTVESIGEDLDNKLDSSAYEPPIEYTGGSHIGIVDHEVSVTGTGILRAGEGINIVSDSSGWIISSSGGNSYTPGQYISIQNDVISATGLQPAGEYLTPSSLNGYATESWVNEQGFLTEVPSEYVTNEELESATSGLQPSGNYLTQEDLDGYATQSWVNEQGFLTEVPSQYVTDQELTEATSGLQPSGDYLVPSDLNGYATQAWTSGYLAENYMDTEAVWQAVTVSLEDYNDYVVQPGLSSKLDSSAYTAPVQSDWNQSNSGALDYIKNKPTIPSAQIQSDWDQSNSAAVDYIKNKPQEEAFTTGPLLPGSGVSFRTSGDNTYIDCSGGGGSSVQSDWTQTNSSAPDYIKNKPVQLPIIAGAGIAIEVTASGIVISCTGGGGTGGTLSIKMISPQSYQNLILKSAPLINGSAATVSRVYGCPVESGTEIWITESLGGYYSYTPTGSNGYMRIEIDSWPSTPTSRDTLVIPTDWNSSNGITVDIEFNNTLVKSVSTISPSQAAGPEAEPVYNVGAMG